MRSAEIDSPACAATGPDIAESFVEPPPDVVVGAHGSEAFVITIIEARPGWRFIDWREMVAYRDLFRFLIWREIKVRYAQSAIGIGWAVIQPLFSMAIFTVIFGKFAEMSSDGVPYAPFTLAALVPWTYFSNALVDGANSLVSNADMLRKVYFPRLLMPLSSVVAKLVDFGIALIMLAGVMSFFGIVPGWNVLALPLLVAIMMIAAAGMSIWLTTLAVQYRDVKHAMNFIVQLLMYASPVVYPASIVPSQYQWLYAINPMVGVIEGFRAALLTTRPTPWDLIAIGALSALGIAVTGIFCFRRRERLFADVA